MNTADVIVKEERVTDGDELANYLHDNIQERKKSFKRTVKYIPIRQYLEHTKKTVSS